MTTPICGTVTQAYTMTELHDIMEVPCITVGYTMLMALRYMQLYSACILC